MKLADIAHMGLFRLAGAHEDWEGAEDVARFVRVGHPRYDCHGTIEARELGCCESYFFRADTEVVRMDVVDHDLLFCPNCEDAPKSQPQCGVCDNDE